MSEVVRHASVAVIDPEKLIFDGDEYFSDLLFAMDQAEQTIDFEVYIFNEDYIGQKIAQALIRAAHRGVRVRLLVDGVGSFTMGADFVRKFYDGGVSFRFFHPLPWQASGSKSFWGLLWFSTVLFFQNVNNRNHRKLVVVDSKIAWTGSMNVSESHMASIVGADKAWRDTMVRIQGPIAEALRQSFDEIWSRMSIPKIRRFLFQLREGRGLKSVAKREYKYNELIARIKESKHRVWIENAYFVPTGKFLKALAAAASRGVDIRILVPAHPDVTFIRYVSSAFYYGLIKSGVAIYQYGPRFLHAKTMIVDDWMTVGSSNLNCRSIFHDLELDVVLNTKRAQDELCHQFKADLAQSQLLTIQDWRARPFFEKILGNVLLLFRYWM